jgi:hypothetical protein
VVSGVWCVSPGGSGGDSVISAIVEESEALSSTCSIGNSRGTASLYD